MAQKASGPHTARKTSWYRKDESSADFSLPGLENKTARLANVSLHATHGEVNILLASFPIRTRHSVRGNGCDPQIEHQISQTPRADHANLNLSLSFSLTPIELVFAAMNREHFGYLIWHFTNHSRRCVKDQLSTHVQSPSQNSGFRTGISPRRFLSHLCEETSETVQITGQSFHRLIRSPSRRPALTSGLSLPPFESQTYIPFHCNNIS